MRFEGQTVLVTGAASGIGKAMVDRFVVEGARVVAVDLRADRLAALRDHDRIVTVAADIVHPDAVRRAIDAAGDRLDILCNNAGIMDSMSGVHDVTDDEWARVLAVNLTAPFHFCREAVRRWIPQGGGVIVNTISLAGLRGGRAGAAYTASKHGLVGLTLNIAATLGDEGIRCNAVCPGGTATAIMSGGGLDERGAAKIIGRDNRRPPVAEPEDIADVAVFLASRDARHLNGAIIPVDNGAIAY